MIVLTYSHNSIVVCNVKINSTTGYNYNCMTSKAVHIVAVDETNFKINFRSGTTVDLLRDFQSFFETRSQKIHILVPSDLIAINKTVIQSAIAVLEYIYRRRRYEDHMIGGGRSTYHVDVRLGFNRNDPTWSRCSGHILNANVSNRVRCIGCACFVFLGLFDRERNNLTDLSEDHISTTTQE